WKDFYSYILGSVNNEEAGASIFLTKDGSRVAIGADGGSSPSTSGRVRVYDLCPSSTILYVNQSASGSNNGSTWANAFTDLQDALRVAENCSIIQEVWVAEGTYHPHTSDRNISFEIPNDMKILGGFPNTGTPTMADRDWDNNLTILSGDIGVNSDNTDNSFRVVYNNGSTANTRLDGFFIEDGSDHLSSNPIGTGMLIEDTNGIGAQMKVQNCTFRYNRTSEGILTMRSSSGTTVNAQVIDCAFLNNFASNRSAGILVYAYNSISQPEFHNNYFEQNVCSAIGGVFSIISENNGTINPKITNSIFYNNTATSRGGVFELDARTGGAISLDIDHCTFNQNVSDAAAVIWNMSDGASTSEAYFDNCIIWNNDGKGSGDFVNSSGTGADTYLRYSIIDEIDCSAIQSNVNLSSTITCLGVKYNEDPRFEDESAADFRLKFCSPAIDAADPVNFSTDDFDYLTRPVGVVADMGAYEFNANSTIPIFQAATPGLGISTIQADWEFTDNTGWTHYCNCANEELLLSLKENGNNVGTIGVDLTVEVSLDEDYGQGNGLDLTSATYNSYPMWLTMNRYWNVFPANQPTTPVGVRFYFDTSDESDVQTMVNSYGGTFSDYKDFVFYKVDYNAYPHDPSIPLADFHEYTYTSGTPAANEWTDGLMGVDLYAEFQVNSFSGGSAAGNGSSSLPLELLSFTGKMKEKHVTLDWTTAFEINVDGFQIERSTDAVNFRQIGWLSAKNDDSGNISSYDWKDHEVENGNVYYYRLKQLDLDGTYEYSKIVAVKVNGKKQTIEIFPKLVSSHLYVQFENDEKDYLIIINNLQGQKVKEVLTTGNTQLDIMDVPNGSYFISIYNYNRLIHSDKIQKMN
ncbi:MAG: choice-of-anchor Q domain-containing protein, partial [Saprospiraceae bacterium]